MRKGYMYILRCADGTYYTGSTNNLDRRLMQHHSDEGPNYTRTHRPIRLIYVEFYERVQDAFYREKQVQGWSRKKKEALIYGQEHQLPVLSLRKSDQEDL